MQTKLISRVLPYLLVFGFFLFDLLSFYNSSVYYPSMWVSELILMILAGGWVIWRGFIVKAGLPKTGLETGLLAFGLAFAINLLFTPEPRLAWPVLASILRFVFLLYFLLDVFDCFPPGNHLLTALLSVSLFFLIMTAIEIVVAYMGWWNAPGTNGLPPYPYRYLSLLFSSNGMMAYLNLFAPLAVVGLARPWNRFVRILCAVWLVLFVFCLPFSSSRGGWLGTTAGVGVLCFCYVVQKGWLQKFFRLQIKTRLIITAGLLAGALLMAAGGLLFLKTFASHPSHGSNIYGGRSDIWRTALQSFIDSPWAGSGAGRLGLEYLGNEESIPPQFWAMHAHSMYIQILSEFGIIGFAAFGYLLFLFVRWFFQAFRRIPEKNNFILAAIAAGFFAFMTQSVFDVFTNSEVIMDPVLFLAATAMLTTGPLKRQKKIRLSTLVAPLGIILIWSIINHWLTQPISTMIGPLEEGNLSEAETWLSEAAQRDPDLRYDHDAYAMVLSLRAELENDPQKLVKAIDELDYVLSTHPAPALWTADLAVMEWSSGNLADAVAHMQKAIDQAPLEPSFYLNLGSMLEETGQTQPAAEAYCQALQLRPAWRGHPFWNLTQVKRQSVENCLVPEVQENPCWRQAQEAIRSGKLDAGERLLSISNWTGEDSIARQITLGLLHEARGETEQAFSVWEKAISQIGEPRLIDDQSFKDAYAYYFERPPLPFELAPGYLQILPDVGQFYAIDRLADGYRDSGDKARLAWVEAMREVAVTGAVQYTPTGNR